MLHISITAATDDAWQRDSSSGPVNGSSPTSSGGTAKINTSSGMPKAKRSLRDTFYTPEKAPAPLSKAVLASSSSAGAHSSEMTNSPLQQQQQQEQRCTCTIRVCRKHNDHNLPVLEDRESLQQLEMQLVSAFMQTVSTFLWRQIAQ
jgi:hypothetical protein